MEFGSVMYLDDSEIKKVDSEDYINLVHSVNDPLAKNVILAYDVPADVYKAVSTFVGVELHDLTCMQKSSVRDDYNIKFTKLFDISTLHTTFVVSANLYEWDKLFKVCKAKYVSDRALAQLVSAVRRDSHGIVDYECVEMFCKEENLKVKLITDYKDCIEDERLVHEILNMQITCSKATLSTLKEFKTTAITDLKPFNRINGTGMMNIDYPDGIDDFAANWISEQINQVYSKVWSLRNIMINNGFSQDAIESLLPQAEKAEVLVTASLLEWRYMYMEVTNNPDRYSKEMRNIVAEVAKELMTNYNFIFKDRGALEINFNFN